MSEIANTLGTPPVLVFQGKEYKVAPLDYDMRGMLERKLQARVLSLVQADRETSDPDDYAQSVASYQRDSVSGVYAWGSEAMQRWLRTEGGLRYFAWVHLARLNPSVGPEMVDAIFADKDALEALFIKITEAGADPNPPKAGWWM